MIEPEKFDQHLVYHFTLPSTVLLSAGRTFLFLFIVLHKAFLRLLWLNIVDLQ